MKLNFDFVMRHFAKLILSLNLMKNLIHQKFAIAKNLRKIFDFDLKIEFLSKNLSSLAHKIRSRLTALKTKASKASLAL